MSLQTFKRRVEKLESVRVRKAQHVVLVFSGTPEADTNADRLIREQQKIAKLQGSELNIVRVRWQS